MEKPENPFGKILSVKVCIKQARSGTKNLVLPVDGRYPVNSFFSLMGELRFSSGVLIGQPDILVGISRQLLAI